MVNIDYVEEVLENLTKNELLKNLGRGLATFYRTLIGEGLPEDFAKILTHRYFVFILKTTENILSEDSSVIDRFVEVVGSDDDYYDDF